VCVDFAGFFEPIDNEIVNVAKAGQAIPVKWRLTDFTGMPLAIPRALLGSTPTASCAVISQEFLRMQLSNTLQGIIRSSVHGGWVLGNLTGRRQRVMPVSA